MSALPFQLKNPALLRDKSYVGGKWVDSKAGKTFDIIDPGSGKVWATAPDNDHNDVNAAVEAAHAAFQQYKKVTPRVRAKALLKWESLIRENIDDFCTIITYETGKPLAEAKGEMEYALGFPWWFAGEAERIQGNISVPSQPGRRIFTIKQPIGVAAALVPWNFPVAMVLRKAGAALAAGCTMVCKPSPESPLSALALAYLTEEAGFPVGVFNVLTTSLENTPALSEALCKHPLVKKVAFTGSTRVGKLVAQHCSFGLKKLTLELGGNCPFLVFDDADLEQAAEALMLLKWRHAGQACISANRVYVQKGVYQKFANIMKERTSKLVVGHGAEKGSTMGPVTTPQSLVKASSQVEDAKKHGGQIILGGGKIEGSGYFFEPTIITSAKKEMKVTDEETFAPLLFLYEFTTEEEAVTAANNTSMGLASYVFSTNVNRIWRMYEQLEAGMIGLNTGNQSAAESPFGGIKESGFGKESGIGVAVEEYLITKTATLTVQGL